jgi:hypothetical protein
MIQRVGVMMLAVGVLAGCYTLRPARGPLPPLGTRVAFDVNDAGRVALGGSMGPEISQVEGRLVSVENGEYVIAVSTVRLLRGGEQVWRGEQVRLKSEHLGPAYVRRFDTARSALVGGTVVGGFTAFLIGRALSGAGSGRDGRVPPDTALTQRGRP